MLFIQNVILKIKDKEKWKAVNVTAYMKVSRTYNEKTIMTDDYQIDMKQLIEAIRDYYNIECGLH